jgi:hypothetical protein
VCVQEPCVYLLSAASVVIRNSFSALPTKPFKISFSTYTTFPKLYPLTLLPFMVTQAVPPIISSNPLTQLVALGVALVATLPPNALAPCAPPPPMESPFSSFHVISITLI